MKSSLFLLSVLASSASALIGYGIPMYNPPCAFACRSVISGAELSCTTHEHHMVKRHSHASPTTPECRANDTAFLTTLAYCIKTHCPLSEAPTWKLEWYWNEKVTGGPGVLPKWTYQEAAEQVQDKPETEYDGESVLNSTSLVNEDDWAAYKRTMINFEGAETQHSKWSIITVVVGFGLPIVLTVFNYLPYFTTLTEKLSPYMIRSLIGKYHVQSLPHLLGNPPTVSQSLYIALFTVLNVIATSVGFKAAQPSKYFSDTYEEILGLVAARTGAIAFALAPLVILFASRNNFLLWVTNWPHSTFILLHRWVARLFAIQSIVHSIAELKLYMYRGTYEQELVQLYWIWGCVATVAISIMLVASVLWVRQKSYEFFLITHVLLAIFTIAGCWYHVEYLFQRKWGYEFWIYAACAVWFFDRAIRIFKILKVGPKRAKVTEIGTNWVRVDIDGVRWPTAPGYHAYVFFPTVARLRPWENHPFSVVPTALLKPSTTATSPISNSDIEKSEIQVITKSASVNSRTHLTTAGLTLFVKKSAGLTNYLKSHDSLLTLLDGPYRNHNDDVLKSDRLVLIAGGIGVSGVLPFTKAHVNTKLYWSVKAEAEELVTELSSVTNELSEKEIRVGERLDIKSLLAYEAEQGWKKIGVVVCGPGSLCDDIRAEVSQLGIQGKGTFDLQVEAFSW